MTDFVTHTIDELCEFTNGFAFKSSDYIEKSEQTIEVFRMGYIKRGGGFKEDSTPVFVPKDYGRDLSKYFLRKDDILIAMTDMKDNVAILANTARIKDDKRFVLNQRVGCLRVKDTEFLDPTFLYFYTNYGPHIANLRSRANSGVQVNLSTSAIKECEITIPNIKVQKAIASVLGALDDKIENNRQVNETLEEMARAIFKSWFVDFDPVHAKSAGNAPAHMDDETAALFPSSFGDDGLPVGWKEVPADAISTITIGKTPPRKEHHWFSNTSEDMKWASIRDMGECGTYIFQTGETLTKQAIEKFNVRVVPKNTVILSFKLTVGRVALTDEEMATNEAIAHFGEADTVYGEVQPEYLYAYLKGFNFDKLGSTSSIATAVNSKIIKAMPVMLADSSCRSAFQKLASPLFEKIRINLRENQTLTELRDTLLPKLMSGEIRVADAEREVEAAV